MSGTTDPTPPAVAAHLASIRCAQNGLKDEWLSLFADNATVHDPVGPSSHDPEGQGFHGRAELVRFWDTMIAGGDLVIVSHRQISSGPMDCACVVTATNRSADLRSYVEMIVTYRVNASGKITQLNAYWDQDALIAQLQGPLP